MSQNTRTLEIIQQEIENEQLRLKNLKAELKLLKPKSGKRIKTYDENGKEVEAVGVLYFYVKLPNKDKEVWRKADKCEILED